MSIREAVRSLTVEIGDAEAVAMLALRWLARRWKERAERLRRTISRIGRCAMRKCGLIAKGSVANDVHQGMSNAVKFLVVEMVGGREVQLLAEMPTLESALRLARNYSVNGLTFKVRKA